MKESMKEKYEKARHSHPTLASLAKNVLSPHHPLPCSLLLGFHPQDPVIYPEPSNCGASHCLELFL